MQDRYDTIWREMETPTKFAWAVAVSFMLHLAIGTLIWRVMYLKAQEPLPPIQTVSFLMEGPESDEPLATQLEPVPVEPEAEPEPVTPEPEPEPEPTPPPEPKPEPEKKPEPIPLPEPAPEPEPIMEEPAPEPEPLEPEPEPEPKPEPKPTPPPEPKPEPKPDPKPEAKPDPKPTPPKPEDAPQARAEGPPEAGISIKQQLPTALGFWGNNVKRKVERVWRVPPAVAIGETVTVMFMVDRSGRLLMEPEVIGKANEFLAASAIQAIRAAVPLPPFPEEYPEPEQQVLMTFRAE